MMSIPEGQNGGNTAWLGRKWLELAILALTAALCLGLGILVGKQDAAGKNPDDKLWIEQLPASELPGAIGTSTPTAATPSASAGQGTAAGMNQAAAAAAAVPSASIPHNYVASKTGSKYYTPDCAAAKRIKDENKVWFATKQTAEAKGYTPSTSCKGL